MDNSFDTARAFEMLADELAGMEQRAASAIERGWAAGPDIEAYKGFVQGIRMEAEKMARKFRKDET
ncbi:MAG: hypothetical protein ACLTOU_00200 [Acutalibacter sp.]